MHENNKPLLIIGGGGHAGVLIDCLLLNGATIIGITDPDKNKHLSLVHDIPVIGGDNTVLLYPSCAVLLINGLGGPAGGPGERKRLFEKFTGIGYNFGSVLHPGAVVSPRAVLGKGVQVMAGSVIQPGCRVGDNAIINTGVSVDHECTIGKHVHLAPGVTLAGGVKVGINAQVGCGATVLENRQIGEGSIVGAGALVVKDVPAGVTVFGVPARVVQ